MYSESPRSFTTGTRMGGARNTGSRPRSHAAPEPEQESSRARSSAEGSAALSAARDQGGEVWGGGQALLETYPDAAYVHPALVRMPAQTEVVRTETFAPICYLMTYDDLDEAILGNNEVSQGLSSCIFTTDLREAERFLSAAGSDCGIANVNIGPGPAAYHAAVVGRHEEQSVVV